MTGTPPPEPPDAGAPRAHLGDLLAILGLLAVVLFLFRSLVFEGRVLFERDLHLVWYSQVAAFQRAIAAGSWPVWDTTVGYGQPLWADPAAEILYPFNWLLLLVEPGTYYNAFVVLHVLWSAVGLWALGRTLGLSQLASTVAAGIWITSGPLLSQVNLWHHFAGSCWIPWVLMASERALSSRRGREALLWGVALALQILAGSADVCAMTLLCVVAMALRHVEWKEPLGRPNREILGVGATALLVALGLSAGVWLPALDAVRHSARSALPAATRLFWSVHPYALVQCVLPIRWNQVPLRPDLRLAFFEGREPFLKSLYLGMPALALAVTALFSPRDRRRWSFVLIALGALLVALGRHAPAYAAVTTLLPPLKVLRYPVKAMVPMGFALSMLAGFGLEDWRRAFARRQWLLRGVLPLLVLAAFGRATVWALQRHADDWGLRVFTTVDAGGALHDILTPTALAFAHATGHTLFALGLALLRLWWPQARWPAAGVGVLCVLDLLAAHTDINRTAPPEFFRFRPPVLDALHLEDHRRLYVREYLTFDPQTDDPEYLNSHPYGIPRGSIDDRAYEVAKALAMDCFLYPPTAGRWGIEGSYDTDLTGLSPSHAAVLRDLFVLVEKAPAYLRLLQVGAVGSVVTFQAKGFETLPPPVEVPTLYKEPIRAYRILDPLPRTYAVGSARVLDGHDALHFLLDPAFDFRSQVILPEGKDQGAAAGFSGGSRIVELKPDRVVVEATLSAPGYVVLVDAWDPGWRVSVDGHATRLLRANTAFRAVAVPGGRHEIVFVCRPWAVPVGLAASGLTLLLVGCGLWRTPPRPGQDAPPA